ncbi:hypothetical protein PVAP13_7KG373201 [Panicum virgatum]|uniref:DUF4283 domain-containing protein n=1 Tax=Panicum virgatum TaxID=38727 RepID=A0A8T0QRP1_PANVG|nr:hypothetical protein PVAP13_7KG373201 [Panicum virgatum]
MQVRTVPEVFFKVEKWNSNAGAKSKIDSAWFRIFGIPMERRSVKRVSLIGSLVGIPLEVDTINLKRWEFVRVKIGCKDVTKVPAVVEGLMDFHFYDFTFQREVPVEGITNSAGTQWTRKSDRANDDNPSPKKPRWGDGGARQDNLSGKSDAGAGPPDYHQGRQHKSQAVNGEPKTDEEPRERPTQKRDRNEGKKSANSLPFHQQNNLGNIGENAYPSEENLSQKENYKQSVDTNKGKTQEVGEEESEDQGLSFDNIISPGGQHLNFGTFENMEIKNICHMQLADNSIVPINEYGTNLFGSKFDPLAAIEAKFALKTGKLPEPMLQENAVCPSPPTGTQEPPTLGVSSQEEQEIQESTIHKEPAAYVTEKEVTVTEEVIHDPNAASIGHISNASESGQTHIDVVNSVTPDMKQNYMRQSERLKKQGPGDIKIADKAETAMIKKNLEGTKLNLDLMLRSNKMDVDTKELALEQFDIIKDLEHVRMSGK